MLINQSYFRKPLVIAQLGQQTVVDGLNDIINRFEPLVLQAALGYDFYDAFINGLDVSSDETIEQRWIDLLNGAAFRTVSGVRKLWVGFAGGSNTTQVVSSQRAPLTIYAGTTPGFAVGGSFYAASGVNGWAYDLESFGNGTLEYGSDWIYKSGGGFTLLNGYLVSPGERFILHFTGQQPVIVQDGGTTSISPLAGIIYYEYMMDLAMQNTGIGLVKSGGENSEKAGIGSAIKPVYAFNIAIGQLSVLWELLNADYNMPPGQRVYPEYDPQQIRHCNEAYSLRYKNNFGI